MAWRGFGGFWLLRYPALDRCQSVIVDVFVLRCCDPHKQCAIAPIPRAVTSPAVRVDGIRNCLSLILIH